MKAREINQKMRGIMNTRTGLKAVGVFAVYLVISSIISYIGVYLPLSKEAYTAYLYMVNLLVLPAFGLGYNKFMLDLYRGKRANAITLFEGFTRRYFFKTVLAMFLLLIAIIALALATVLLYSILSFVLVSILSAVSNTLVMNILFGILLLVLFVFIYYFASLISQIYYRLIDNPSAGSWQALKSSIAMMKGRVWNYFVQNLSLLPLILLPFFVNGIVLLVYNLIFNDFPTFYIGSDWFTSFVNITNTLTMYLASKTTLLFIVSIITSLLVTPRITMSLSIWYDDKVRAANLEIEE